MRGLVVLFDLDGTLVDSRPGIVNSYHYTMRRLGLPRLDEAAMQRFLGPPVHDALASLGLTEASFARAVAEYRAYYSATGLYEAEAYDGVPEALALLEELSVTMAVATSKPEPFAQRVLAHCGLDRHFSVVAGAQLDGSRRDKQSVIQHAVRRLGGGSGRRIVMVGDRAQDGAGARACRLPFVGAGWGYGSEAELVAAGAVAIAATPGALRRTLAAVDDSGHDEGDAEGQADADDE